jgi:hypothetical protein
MAKMKDMTMMERKHGGRTKKHGGKVHGDKPMARADKRARGGRMTPESPLSGAGDTKGGCEPEKGDRASGGRLSASSRNALPASDFALPGKGTGDKGKGPGSFPIPDASHARNALARSANKSPAVKAKVRAAVHAKFPGIGAK